MKITTKMVVMWIEISIHDRFRPIWAHQVDVDKNKIKKKKKNFFAVELAITDIERANTDKGYKNKNGNTDKMSMPCFFIWNTKKQGIDTRQA